MNLGACWGARRTAPGLIVAGSERFKDDDLPHNGPSFLYVRFYLLIYLLNT